MARPRNTVQRHFIANEPILLGVFHPLGLFALLRDSRFGGMFAFPFPFLSARALLMRFSEFTLPEVRAINQRTIERLRAQQTAMSGHDDGRSPETPSAWSRSPSAVFTPSEIRAAFISAAVKLRSQD